MSRELHNVANKFLDSLDARHAINLKEVTGKDTDEQHLDQAKPYVRKPLKGKMLKMMRRIFITEKHILNQSQLEVPAADCAFALLPPEQWKKFSYTVAKELASANAVGNFSESVALSRNELEGQGDLLDQLSREVTEHLNSLAIHPTISQALNNPKGAWKQVLEVKRNYPLHLMVIQPVYQKIHRLAANLSMVAHNRAVARHEASVVKAVRAALSEHLTKAAPNIVASVRLVHGEIPFKHINLLSSTQGSSKIVIRLVQRKAKK